jgi:RNA polymerase sigma-70 factor (ECF subfamily)
MNLEVSLPISGKGLLRQPLRVTREECAGLRDLTTAIRRGDEAAFTRFHGLYSLRLYKYLLVLAKGDELEAREVLQAVVLKCATKMEVFDEERRLWAWICRLARNAFIDRYRARQRDGRHISLEQLPADQTDGRDAENRLAQSLEAALATFAPDEAELLRAVYIDDRPLQELADEAGQSYKAVESRLGRLRRKLKEAMLNNLRDEKGL